MTTMQNRNGFSMVEVLVAATILVVIVMMLAMLFQQTSLSWRVGVRRADSFMQLRSAFGAIQRDASAAVDERTLPQALRSRLGGSQQFGGPLQFFTLAGDGWKDDNNNGAFDSSETPFRALSFVTYNTSGKRTETSLKADGGTESKSSDILNFITKASSKNKPVTRISGFEPVFGSGPNANAGLPLFVKIRAEVTSQGYALDIGAGSAGPDRTWNTKDDIKTWVED